MRLILCALAGGTAVIASACASAPPRRLDDSKPYVVEVLTTRSETEVKRCASLMTPQRSGFEIPMPGTGERINSKYGPGTVSNYISYRTTRVGNEIVLRIVAHSFVFPDSGLSQENSNMAAIPATPEARAKVDAIATNCA